MSKDTNLVIDRDLIMNKASLNKILQDVYDVEQRISDTLDNEHKLNVSIELNESQLTNIQNSLKRINSDLHVNLQLDRKSTLKLEQEIQRIKTSIDMNVNAQSSMGGKNPQSNPTNILNQINEFTGKVEETKSTFENLNSYVDLVMGFSFKNVTDFATKLSRGFSRLLPVTAILLGAFEGIPYAVNRWKEYQAYEAERPKKLNFNSEGQKEVFKSHLNRYFELQNKASSQKDTIPFGKNIMVEYPNIKALSSEEQKEFNNLDDILRSRGGIEVYKEYIDYKKIDSNGVEQSYMVPNAYYEEHSVKLNELFDNLTLKEVEFLEQLRTEIGEIYELFGDISDYQVFSNLANEIKTSGTIESVLFLSDQIKELTVSASAYKEIGSFIQLKDNFKDEKERVTQEKEKIGEKAWGSVDLKVREDIYNNYDEYKGNEKSYLEKFRNRKNEGFKIIPEDKFGDIIKYFDLVDEIQELEKHDGIFSEGDKIIQNYGKQIALLKELTNEYVVAASGIKIFDEALKSVSNNISNAQTNLSLATSDAWKIQASKNVISQMGQESILLEDKIASIQQQMVNLIETHGVSEFTFEKLYMPSPGDEDVSGIRDMVR
ncbi:hypothetical protein [Chengkuizengella axinellae]|uniref:LXG domain-containing protein n=1 Tax=Chengkuizengella axinellae TaxID=3064388 RepID=A0ABT9IWC4_9BACL|nr:hypothetical protein [Chengkuizengella sp. 2205SS18-9]MDP5273668.1 hypothetical protein [Chengkuizengella sp. 2205SS18-9]